MDTHFSRNPVVEVLVRIRLVPTRQQIFRAPGRLPIGMKAGTEHVAPLFEPRLVIPPEPFSRQEGASFNVLVELGFELGHGLISLVSRWRKPRPRDDRLDRGVM
jgi:hypothetical protein